MDVWGFVGLTGGVLLLMALLYLVIELIGRSAEKKHRNAAREALNRWWEENKDKLRKDLPCPSCSIPFTAPDATYFECPNCGYLLTTEWVKNYHHRKLKEEWENSFSGRYYRMTPQVGYDSSIRDTDNEHKKKEKSS